MGRGLRGRAGSGAARRLAARLQHRGCLIWTWTGDRRPAWAETPGPGQESVWDFPRPPRLEPVEAELRVEHAGELIARTDRGVRVVETASAPVYYFPPEDVRTELLEETGRTSFCEWKGRAHYYDLVVGDERVRQAAWSYPDPTPRFTELAGWLAFYAGRVDTARVGDVTAEPQPGGFYGGWVTPDLAGPIKGEPGSSGW